MRDYGVVSPKFWIGGTGKSLRGNVEAQVVALYLMTSPHANMIGVFYCPLDTIAKETGLPIEGASKGLQSLIEADFVRFDADTEEVFALRMAAYQVGEQLEVKDNRCKGVARELERVMSDRLRADFRAIYSGAFHIPPEAPKFSIPPPSSEAPSEPLRSQKQDQKQDQEQEQKEETPRKRDAAQAVARPDDVAEQVWRDWLALRKGKRATVSETTLEGARDESVKAGIPLESFLRLWCVLGWQGLTADRIKPEHRRMADDWRAEQRERTQIAAPGVAVHGGHAQFFVDVDARMVDAPALTRSPA